MILEKVADYFKAKIGYTFPDGSFQQSAIVSKRGRANSDPALANSLRLKYGNTKIGTFTYPAAGVTIAFDGIHLWTFVSSPLQAIRYNITTGESVTISLPSSVKSFGAIYADGHIWIACNDSNIRKININTMEIVSTVSLNALKFAYTGEFLYAITTGNEVKKINITTDSIVSTFGTGVNSIVFDGDYLWLGISSAVKKFNITTELEIASVATAAGVNIDMQFDGVFLWTHPFGASGVSKIDVTANSIVTTVPTVASLRGLVFDGKYVWANQGNPEASNEWYRIDIAKNAITYQLNIPAGYEFITGALFDGTHLWTAALGLVTKSMV